MENLESQKTLKISVVQKMFRFVINQYFNIATAISLTCNGFKQYMLLLIKNDKNSNGTPRRYYRHLDHLMISSKCP